MSDILVAVDQHTTLRPIFDPVVRIFTVQLLRGGGVITTFGERNGDTVMTHPDDAADVIHDFLESVGAAPLDERTFGLFCRALIMAKGGPDAALLKMAEANPQGFLVL
ncbi:hypothetical protein ABT095_25685 [Kitasatospora sp. NPDC002227]|uniref:hypothetical protein n=1 Tax=Kitasatospora sp. NPDC002227 TaxID=3154773 RepID=UPI003322DC70